MAEYIEREAVEALLSYACAECRDSSEEYDGIYADCDLCLLGGVKNKLLKIIRVDVVPVVRCKDCSYFEGRGICNAWNVYGPVPTQDDGYCYRGVKRDG